MSTETTVTSSGSLAAKAWALVMHGRSFVFYVAWSLVGSMSLLGMFAILDRGTAHPAPDSTSWMTVAWLYLPTVIWFALVMLVLPMATAWVGQLLTVYLMQRPTRNLSTAAWLRVSSGLHAGSVLGWFGVSVCFAAALGFFLATMRGLHEVANLGEVRLGWLSQGNAPERACVAIASVIAAIWLLVLAISFLACLGTERADRRKAAMEQAG